MNNSYVLRWSRTSGRRRQDLAGMDRFAHNRMADLLCQVEALLDLGYTVSITPPDTSALPLVDVAICDV